MTWTKQQSEGFADWTAQELSNRQLLVTGNGVPDFDAPLNTDYVDETASPPARYRKVRAGVSGWVQYTIQRAATQAEVDQGNDRENFVSPLTLSNRLTAFAAEIGAGVAGVLELLADSAKNGADFSITIPPGTTATLLAISVTGYGPTATLVNILGGNPGQIISLKRGGKDALNITQNNQLKLTATLLLDDLGKQDNITLQKVSQTHWIELSRSIFE